MSEENKKEIKIVPTVKPTKLNIKPVPTEVKTNTTVTPKVTPKPKIVIKPKQVNTPNIETPVNKVIKPTPVVTPKPVVEEKKVIKEEKKEVKEEIKEEKKEEVKEIKTVAHPDPKFAPKNAFAPPDLNQEKEKIFEQESNAYQSNLNIINDNKSEANNLYEAFVGKNYQKILTRTINFPGLFFGVLYMFYRKLFLYGILVIIAQVILTILLPSYITKMPYLAFIPNLLIGFLFNKVYLSFAGKKIDRIKSNNLRATKEELRELCAKEGGTSIGKIFLGLFVTTIISILIGLLIAFVILGLSFKRIIDFVKDPIHTNLSLDVEDDDELPKGKDYDGIIVYDTSKKITDIFKITIPDKFNQDDDTFEYQYKGTTGVFNECKFRFSALKMYNDAEKLITEIKDYNKNYKTSQVNKEKINNINWVWVSYEDSIGKTYNYATLYEKRIFFFEYEIEKDADKDCASFKDKIINSTSFR